MSATGHDAVNGARGTMPSLDAPEAAEEFDADFTEDLANEDTSELGGGTRAARPAASVEHAADDAAPARRAVVAAPGAVLRERYRLEAQIGTGGAATVYRALDLRRDAAGTGQGREVAIKLLRPELREQPQCVARLQREFRQTQSISHPNVVRALDLDCEGDAWFLVMELLAGETLGPVLRRAAPRGLPMQEAMRIALAAGDALAHAHARGVVHGDVKPGNLFLTEAGEVRVIDFGVAPDAPAQGDAAAAAEPVAAAATRAYASPEVLAGEPPEARDDVFSLACVVHEMVSGHHPFGRRGADRARDAAVVPERLAALGPARASALAAALSFSRKGRPSMAGLVSALRADAPSAKAPAPVPAVAAAAAVAPAPAARSRLALPAAAAVAVALVVGIAIGRLDDAPEPALPTVAVPSFQGAAAVAAEPLPPPLPLAAIAPATQPEEAAAEAEFAVEEPPAPPGPPGLVFFDAPRMVVSRTAVIAPIAVRHLSHVRRPVTVNWRAIDGSARSGRDYGGPQSGVESFVEGNSFRMLYIPILPNASATRDRSFTVELTDVSSGMQLGPTARIEVTILGGP